MHYLRARLNRPREKQPVAGDFFILAESDLDAGAVAHDICRERSWEFSAYLALAQVVGRSDIEGEPEHIRAFEIAQSAGYAVVISELLPGEDE